MPYVRIKTNKQGKKYAYQVTSKWDKEKKQARSTSKYLGTVDQDGNIIPKKSASKAGKKNNTSQKQTKQLQKLAPAKQEKLIQDFGNGYLLDHMFKTSDIYEPLKPFIDKHPELLSLMTYRLCNPGAMYNCQTWLSGNIAGSLHKGHELSSQHISRLLKAIGQEDVQRAFFKAYLQQEQVAEKQVIIDATALPNQGSTSFNAWGRNEHGIEKQFKFHCVIDQDKQKPLFYRYTPGNIADVSTLNNTIEELKALGVQYKFALLDAGYCSEKNIKLLKDNNIDFLMRLPKSRRLYKEVIDATASSLETLDNAVVYNGRSLFIAQQEVELPGLEGEKGYVYAILDPQKRAKDIQRLLEERKEGPDERDEQKDQWQLRCAGIFTLISSKEIAANELLSAYYMRQSIEQVFGFAKSDLEMLPIRCHSEETIRGYLFLNFLLLVVFTELRKKLEGIFTVEQALLLTQNLKCKIFSKEILVQEPTKKQKQVFELCDTIVPMKLGI